MTEDEARQKWCPYRARGQRDAFSTPELTPKTCCIASDCMAWRWRHWRNGSGTGIIREGKVDDTFIEPCAPPENTKFYIHEGFCGLAGKP